MSIRLRLMTLIASFGLVALLITGLAMTYMSDYRRGLMVRYGQAHEQAYVIERLHHTVSRAIMESHDIYDAQPPSEVRRLASLLSHDLDKLEADLSEWRNSPDPLTRDRYQTVSTAAARFISPRRVLARLVSEGRLDEARQLGATLIEDHLTIQAQLDTVMADVIKDMAVTEADTTRFASSRTRAFLVIALFSIAFILAGSTWLILTFVTRPLRQVAGTIINLSEGQLDTPVPDVTGKDEVADVWRAVARLKINAVEAEKVMAAQREIERQQTLEARQLLLD